MNNSVMNEMNYYENANDNIQTIEKAVLAENLTFSALEAVEGKFFIPSTTPSIETENATTKKTNKYTQSNYVELVIPPHILLMFMNPKLVPITNIKHNPSQCTPESSTLNHTITGVNYILGFATNKFTIPKGTEFLIEFLGGHMEIDHISIVGIFSIAAAKTGKSI